MVVVSFFSRSPWILQLRFLRFPIYKKKAPRAAAANGAPPASILLAAPVYLAGGAVVVPLRETGTDGTALLRVGLEAGAVPGAVVTGLVTAHPPGHGMTIVVAAVTA